MFGQQRPCHPFAAGNVGDIGPSGQAIGRFMRIGVVAKIHARLDPGLEIADLARAVAFVELAFVDETDGRHVVMLQAAQDHQVGIVRIGLRLQQAETGQVVEGQGDGVPSRRIWGRRILGHGRNRRWRQPQRQQCRNPSAHTPHSPKTNSAEQSFSYSKGRVFRSSGKPLRTCHSYQLTPMSSSGLRRVRWITRTTIARTSSARTLPSGPVVPPLNQSGPAGLDVISASTAG